MDRRRSGRASPGRSPRCRVSAGPRRGTAWLAGSPGCFADALCERGNQPGGLSVRSPFCASACGPCPARGLCTAGKSTTALAAAPRPGQSPGRRRTAVRRFPSKPTTPAAPASKAPCTRPPATARDATATAACPQPGSTTCTWPARSISSGWRHSGPARHETGSEPATWHASNSVSPRRTRITTRIPQAVPAAGRHPLALELAAAQLRVLSLPHAASFTPITSVTR